MGVLLFLVASCSIGEHSSDEGGHVISFSDLPNLKCTHGEDGRGLIVKQESLNSGIMVYTGFDISMRRVKGEDAIVFSIRGRTDLNDRSSKKITIFSGAAGGYLLLLPTVNAVDLTPVFYKDDDGLHKIGFVSDNNK